LATLTASKARQVAAVTAAGLFVGLDIWIVVMLASDFMLLFMVAAPCLSICYLISEVVKLWRHR
jgi:hypothetical protein